MTNKVSEQQQKKKLLKQRRQILEELQEAQKAEANALERFHRAEARLQRRTSRVQRVAADLMLIRQQLGEPSGHPQGITSASPQTEPTIVESIAPAEEAQAIVPTQIEEKLHTDALNEPERAALSPEEAAYLAREARAAAEAAEQAAREATERAVAVATHLEQVSSGRHLMQELLQLQTEAEHATTIAQEAEHAAQEAELLAAQSGAEAIDATPNEHASGETLDDGQFVDGATSNIPMPKNDED